MVLYRVARTLTDGKYSTFRSILNARIGRNLRRKPEKWHIYRWLNTKNRWKIIE